VGRNTYFNGSKGLGHKFMGLTFEKNRQLDGEKAEFAIFRNRCVPDFERFK
jgi:hypothetical protein